MKNTSLFKSINWIKLSISIFFFFGFTHLQAQLFHENLVQQGDLSFEEIVEKSERYFDKKGRERGNGYKQFQRWKYWAERNLDENRKVRDDKKALQDYNKYFGSNSSSQRVLDGSYVELGPLSATNTSTWSSALGRISAIGLDPNDDNHIIAGSPTGGIWKTTDYGTNWTPLFDDQLLMDVFSLEISHTNPNVYFAGLSSGVVKSTDGGNIWNGVSGATSGIFNTITMHPTNQNVVFAVEQNAGRVHKSINEGDNFYSVMDHSAAMYDLEFHPGNSDIVYASGNDAVYKSTDGGENFTSINSGPWSGSGNTMMMAVTPAAPSNLYVIEEAGGAFNAIYFSNDEGVSWSTITDNTCNCQNMFGYDLNGSGGQAPRDMDMIVSPVDPDIIHIAGTESYMSTDFGQNWSQTTFWNTPDASNFIHADIDILIYDNNRIVTGTDGGIYFSTNEASTWTDITSDIGVRQFYRIGASLTDADRVSGGSQDNGTGVLVGGTWFDFVGADGMETFIDWSNADIVYATTQFGGLYKSSDGGQTLNNQISTPSGNGNWVTPFEQDPTDPNTIYTGRQEVWKSTDGGSSWVAISSLAAGAVDELKIAPSDNSRIYAAFNNIIYYTSDGGITWNSSTTPSGNVNYIAVDPFNADRLSVAVTGTASRVYESTDGAATWNDISANIPSGISIECVLYEQVENGGLYCGGNPGIYFAANTSSPVWEDCSNNLPKVRVTELEIRNQVMYVGTYGRGLWKFEFICDGSLTGLGCNDLDGCTINDVYDENCNCAGTLLDSDGDTVCDGLDVCPGGDDTIDGDNDGIPDFCDGCATDCPDSDCDSVCDADDICPDGDDTRDMDDDGIPDYCDECDDIIGTTCDDNDACTVNDVYDSDCNCLGTLSDSDSDGVCDANDVCPGEDDTADIDGDGIPDACDSCNDLIETPVLFLEIKLDNYPEETSWDIKDNLGGVLLSSNGTYANFADGTIVNESFCNIDLDCYEFTIYDSYGDGICCSYGQGYYLLKNSVGDTLALGGDFASSETTAFCIDCSARGGDADADGVCADDDCDDSDASIGGAGSACDDGDICTTGDVYDVNCNCAGTFEDSDGDGVCDADDICPGFDDTIDTDGDTIPDGCDTDECVQETSSFNDNPLVHTGTGQSGALLTLPSGSTDISFTISDIDALVDGNPSGRYIDKVTVDYVDGSGTSIQQGIYTGDAIPTMTVDILIPGEVQSITVTLEDGLDGDAVIPIQISFTDVSYCLDGDAFTTDLTISTLMLPSSTNGPSPVVYIVSVLEIGSSNSTGTITAILPKDSKLQFTWDPLLETIGSTNVDNQEWMYDGSNSGFHIWTNISDIPSNGVLKFGFEGTFDPVGTSGSVSYTTTILATSGGEENSSNNIDVESLLFFSN